MVAKAPVAVQIAHKKPPYEGLTIPSLAKDFHPLTPEKVKPRYRWIRPSDLTRNRGESAKLTMRSVAKGARGQ